MAKTPTCITDPDGPVHLILTALRGPRFDRIIAKDARGYVIAEADTEAELVAKGVNLANVATINGEVQ